MRELLSIVDYGEWAPAVGSGFDDACTPGCSNTVCSCTRLSGYWSSTTYHNDPSRAWTVNFYTAQTGNGGKGGVAGVRAVRTHVGE